MDSWWQRPLLRDESESEEERRATWFELFFDLGFVALVAFLAQGLSREVDLVGVAEFALFFAAAWITWRGAAIYSDRFETDDLSYRLSLLAVMASVSAMGAAVARGFFAGFTEFAIAYLVARAVLLTMWVRAGYHNATFRPLSDWLVVGYAIAMPLWAVAAVVGPQIGWWFAAAGLAVEYATPVATLRVQARLPSLSSTHLPERFGLFTIIVLGEAVISAISGMGRASDRAFVTWLAAACALLLPTGIWWLYFDHVMTGRPALTTPRRTAAQYLHLPLTMAIAATSAVFAELILAPTHPFSPSSRLVLSFGVGTALICIALIEMLGVRDPLLDCLLHRNRMLKIGGGLLAVAIGFFAGSWPALLLAGVLAGAVAIAVAQGVVAQSRSAC